MAFAVGFGLLAAFLFAAAASLQQHVARQGPLGHARDRHGRLARSTAIFGALWRLIKRLVRTPLWLAGWSANLLGFLVQAVALHFGSVTVVQPLLVTQLMFALPLASAWRRRWPVWRDWTSAAIIVGGLVVFLTVGNVAPLEDEPDRFRLLLGIGAALAAVLLAMLVGSSVPRPVRATLIAAAAGVCFAVSAAMIKLTSDDLLHRGAAATARDWPGYVLALSTLIGLLLEQGAFAAGSLPAAVAAMSITNPVGSYLLGVFAFGVATPTEPGALAALTGAAVLICAGAIGLAHSPIVRADSSDVSGETAGEYRGV